MRTIHLDPLAKQFFNNDFPGYTDKITLHDNPLSNRVPFAELELDINTDDILSIAKDIQDQVTDLHERKQYTGEDYKRVDNVKSLLLWSDGKKEGWINDIYYKKRAPNYPIKEPTVETQQIKDLLFASGIDATACWLHSLEPSGYFRPHRDIKLDPTPLDYFWIPLNTMPGSQLRSYPYGEIKTTVGNAYLLNTDDFVHGVYNGGDETRYVLLGHINSDVGDKIKTMINHNLGKWCRYSDSN